MLSGAKNLGVGPTPSQIPRRIAPQNDRKPFGEMR
jgi:hypothetical protein